MHRWWDASEFQPKLICRCHCPTTTAPSMARRCTKKKKNFPPPSALGIAGDYRSDAAVRLRVSSFGSATATCALYLQPFYPAAPFARGARSYRCDETI